jgi:hypothetical protein
VAEAVIEAILIQALKQANINEIDEMMNMSQ